MKPTELLIAVAMTVSATAMAATAPAPFKPGERVGFFGDSISEVGNQTFYLEYLTAIRHPGTGVRFENMGKSGDKSWGGAARWATEPAAKGVGRVFVMFGMNDIGSESCAEKYPRAMREIVRQLQADGKEIVLLTPSPYDVWGHQPKPLERSDEKLSACAEAVRALAEEKALPLVDLMGPMRKIYQENPDRWFNNDRIHPDFAGHMLMASLIWSATGEKGEFSRVELDAAGGSSLESSYTPQGLPCAVDADYRKLAAVYPLSERLNTETLVVKNLAPGRYDLKADGASLGSFTAMELAAGVNLAERETPNQARSRQAIETARQLARLAQDCRVFRQVLSWMADDKVDSEDAAAVANWVKGKRPKPKSPAWGSYRKRMFDKFETLYPDRHELPARVDALHAQIAAVRPVTWRLSLTRVTQPALFGAAGPAAAKLSLDAPGHVYTDREAATAQGGAPGAAWTLTDWRGRALASGTFAPDGRAALGKRPVGYYHVTSEGADATFAVVPVPEGRMRNSDSFYGVDSAQSWISRPGKTDCPWYGGDSWRLVSDLLWRSGIPHVRERLGAAEANPRPGVYDFGRYMYNADLLQARGMLVSGMFHDVPKHMDRIQKLPRDLAALYAFCRDTAAAFGDRMGDWEFWNEQDITFAPEPAWDYVSALKAASLGFKAAQPTKPVLIGALCGKERSVYDDVLYANDAAKYSDVFNFHTYVPLCRYPAVFADLRAFLAKAGIAGRAVWTTECGTNSEGLSDADAAGPVKGLKAHSPAQELVHAEFYAKSQVLLQMQGVSRNYFFVFGALNERGGKKDWGVQRRDGTVKPAYAAMSAMVRELGAARLVGEVKLGDGFRGYLFAQPDGLQTLAFWRVSPLDTETGVVSSEPDLAATLALPVPPSGPYMLTDLCGQRTTFATNVVTATRYTAYLTGRLGLSADVPPFPCGKPTPYAPAADEDFSVVFRVDLNTNDFRIAERKSVAELDAEKGRFRLHVWNLSDRPKRGTVSAAGGVLAGLPAEIALPPMGKASFDCTYAAKRGDALSGPFVLSGVFDGRRTSRLAIPVRDTKVYADCTATELKNWRDPKAWRRNTSADRDSVVWDEGEKALRFDFAWTKTKDRWFYPVYALSLPEESVDGAVMFEFEVKTAQDKVENDFSCQYLMLVYADPSRRAKQLAYSAPLTEWETRRVALTDGLSGERPVGVKAIRLGVNPKGTTCTFWLRNPRILRK